MRRRRVKRSGGFTIIEVMIAMLLLAIAVTGMAAMQVTIVRTSTDSRVVTMATAIAQSRLEQFRGMPYINIAAGTDNDVCFTYQGVVTPCTGVFFFTRTASVTAIGNGFRLATSVLWSDRDGGRNVDMLVERTP